MMRSRYVYYREGQVVRATHLWPLNLQAYMTELIQERKAANSKEERYDLFSSLLDANDEDAEVTLTHSELLGTPPTIESRVNMLTVEHQEISSSFC